MAKDLKQPSVSIVLSVYNGAMYLRESLDSLLNQSFKDFELIIINDGSTDDTAKILSSYKDDRIKMYEQDNLGLVSALNRGIGLASGKYIARQDADDKSEPKRLERQVASLEDNTELVVIGSSMSVMDETSKKKHVHKVLLNDPELKQELLVRSPFAHGSVMFKKDAFNRAGRYRQNEYPAEDYGLWLRLSEFGNFANFDSPLYVYRESDRSISSQNAELQDTRKHEIQNMAWTKRRHLLAKRIDTSGYAELDMGQLRIDRITQNLTYVLGKSLRKFHFFAAGRI